jgi:hypothetical protein
MTPPVTTSPCLRPNHQTTRRWPYAASLLKLRLRESKHLRSHLKFLRSMKRVFILGLLDLRTGRIVIEPRQDFRLGPCQG